MPRPSRIRRIAKWTGVGVCVLILAAWGFNVFSGYGAYTPVGKRGFLGVDGGAVGFGAADDTWRWAPKPQIGIDLWDSIGARLPLIRTATNFLVIVVPFRMLLPVVAIPTIILFLRDRRRIPPGHCAKCGYDLTGNVSGRCSECGTPVAPAAAAATPPPPASDPAEPPGPGP